MPQPRRTQANSLPAVTFQQESETLSLVNFGDGKLFVRALDPSGVNAAFDLELADIRKLVKFIVDNYSDVLP